MPSELLAKLLSFNMSTFLHFIKNKKPKNNFKITPPGLAAEESYFSLIRYYPDGRKTKNTWLKYLDRQASGGSGLKFNLICS